MNKLIIDSRENSELYSAVRDESIKLNLMTEKQWLEIGDMFFKMFVLRPSLLLISYSL